MSVAALIPAFNEAERIAVTVAAATRAPLIDHVLVIDDGSRDDTASVARHAGAEVLRLGRNAGKGAALAAGVTHLDGSADVVVFLDADLGDTAEQATLLIRPVLAGAADMAIAIFPPPARPGGFGLVKRLAKTGLRILAGFEAQAPLSGQRALSRAALTAAGPMAHGFGAEVALTIRVARAGLTVIEVPTTMAHAATGRDLAGFIHRGRQFIDVAMTLARLALEHQSPRVSGG